jgi:hypothetical protein
MIAKVKYDLPLDVVEAFEDLILECYNNQFTPRRTVEVVAESVNFSLKN